MDSSYYSSFSTITEKLNNIESGNNFLLNAIASGNGLDKLQNRANLQINGTTASRQAESVANNATGKANVNSAISEADYYALIKEIKDIGSKFETQSWEVFSKMSKEEQEKYIKDAKKSINGYKKIKNVDDK